MTDRFVLSTINPDQYILIDRVNFVSCKFNYKRFNETENFEMVQDFKPANFMQLAQICREMTDWLIENHKDIL